MSEASIGEGATTVAQECTIEGRPDRRARRAVGAVDWGWSTNTAPTALRLALQASSRDIRHALRAPTTDAPGIAPPTEAVDSGITEPSIYAERHASAWIPLPHGPRSRRTSFSTSDVRLNHNSLSINQNSHLKPINPTYRSLRNNIPHLLNTAPKPRIFNDSPLFIAETQPNPTATMTSDSPFIRLVCTRS